jgi:glucarate dehydratase
LSDSPGDMSPPVAGSMGQAIEDLNNDYYEDPAWGLEGMRRVREFVRIPTATNQVVVNFEQLTQNVRAIAADVVLLDTTFWADCGRRGWGA